MEFFIVVENEELENVNIDTRETEKMKHKREKENNIIHNFWFIDIEISRGTKTKKIPKKNSQSKKELQSNR